MVADTLLQTGASSDDPHDGDAHALPPHPYLHLQAMQIAVFDFPFTSGRMCPYNNCRLAQFVTEIN